MKMFILLATLLFVGTAAGAERFEPPCGGAAVPAYPVSIGLPVVQNQTVSTWTPAACLGWSGAKPTLLVAVAARLREPGGAAMLLARFGAISGLRGLRYWSVTDQAWQTLVTDASAVTNAGGSRRRGDFQVDEMRVDTPLYSTERDSRSSEPVLYRTQVMARTPDRIVVHVTNITPVRKSWVTLFAPGELQSTFFLDHLGAGDWGYYGLWGITTGLLTSGHAASSINRAVAFYRHFADIPTDQDPPAAR